MALETLNGIEEIDGFKVIRGKPDHLSWEEFDECRSEYPICITDKENMISFKIQNGPIKEVGMNGCQVGTLICAAAIMIEKLDEKFPSKWNEHCLDSLNDALRCLAERTQDRVKRGVEGKSEK